MIYATREAALSARFMLNSHQIGYAPAYIYRCQGGWTVVRTWDSSASLAGLVLDD